MIQQTWAYRADDPRLPAGGEWGIGQDGMYARLTQAYLKLAHELGDLRIIPSGHAVQLTRKHQGYNFVPCDPDVLKTLRWPDLPSQAGDVVGAMGYRKNREMGQKAVDTFEREP